MPTSLDLSWDLPYAPAALFEQGVRPEFIVAMAEAVGQRKLEIRELQKTDEGGHVVARYEVDVDMPSWAKKFVPPTNMVTERREWGLPDSEGNLHYSVSLRLDNVPIRMDGQVGLLADGAATVNTVHFDIEAQLPFFAKKLEDMSLADLTRNCELQREFILEWMKTHG